MEAPAKASKPQGRVSRFLEASMDSKKSIHPPPSLFMRNPGESKTQSLQFESLLDGYHQEATQPAVGSKRDSHLSASTTDTSKKRQGFFRSIAIALNPFNAFSKAYNEAAEEIVKEQSQTSQKAEAERAYQQLKESGMLPTPKVFVRPVRPSTAVTPGNTSDATISTPNTNTPHTIRKSVSKKDLRQQKKLSKRVSDLETKLQEARRELAYALGDTPPVPPLPPNLTNIAIPNGRFTPSSQVSLLVPNRLPSVPSESLLVSSEESVMPDKHDSKVSSIAESMKMEAIVSNSIQASVEEVQDTSGGVVVQQHVEETTYNIDSTPSVPTRKITKKRKAGKDDAIYRPHTESEDESEWDEAKPAKRVKKQRSSGKLVKKRSRSGAKDEASAVRVVPDGVSVPPLPPLPNAVEGEKATVSDDGFGGLGHEIF